MKNQLSFTDLLNSITFTTCFLSLGLCVSFFFLLVGTFLLGAISYRSYVRFLNVTGQETVNVKHVIAVKSELTYYKVRSLFLDTKLYVVYYAKRAFNALKSELSYRSYLVSNWIKNIPSLKLTVNIVYPNNQTKKAIVKACNPSQFRFYYSLC